MANMGKLGKVPSLGGRPAQQAMNNAMSARGMPDGVKKGPILNKKSGTVPANKATTQPKGKAKPTVKGRAKGFSKKAVANTKGS